MLKTLSSPGLNQGFLESCYNRGMSGHSKWATIHRQKEVKDAKRGNLFSKLARAITLAAREGGGNPDGNIKLRVAIDKARESNMPKDNIERAIHLAQGGGALEEVFYEGFGPGGIAVIVEAATDNRNRTGQEIKNIFERGGGSLAGPGAVLFNFENKGLLVVKKALDVEGQMLALIDAGVEDVEETPDGIEVYTQPDKLAEVRGKIEELGYEVITSELYMKPKNLITLTDKRDASRALAFLESLEEHDDVQRVFANLDVPDQLAK